MAGVELATAYIQLVPSLRGAQREIQRQMGPIGSRTGQQFGQDFNDSASDELGGSRGFGGTVKSAGGFGLKFGVAFGAAAAGAIGVAVGAALKEAAEQEVATDRLAASLGANEKQSARLGEVAGSLYAQAYGESFGEVTEAIGAVRGSFRELGTGKDLERVTKQALDFAEIFALDVPRATQVAQTAVRSGFAKNATNALDLFTKGLQKVAPSLREPILDAVDEYGQFFNSVGISGPKAMGLLVAGAEKGEFGIDKLGDAIKEFTILSTELDNPAYETLGLDAETMANRIANGGKGARTATNEIVDGLLAIKSPAKQAQAAVQLFGSPFEDLNKTQVPELLNSLKTGEKGLGKFRGAIDKAGGTLNDNASKNLESFKRQVTQTFVNVVGGEVLPAISAFARDLATKYGPQVVEFGQFFVRDIVPKIREFITYLQTNVVPVVKDLIQNTINTIIALRPKFIETFNSIKTIFVSITSIITSVWQRFGTNIKTFISGIMRAVVNVISGVFNIIAGIFKTFAALLKGDWRGVWEGIKQVVRGAGQIIKGIVGGLFSAIRLAFTVAGKALLGIMGKAFEGIVRLVTTQTGKITDAVAAIPGKIKELGSKFLAAGKDVMSKIFEGIKSGADGVAGFVSDIAQSIKDAINNALGLPVKINGPGPLPDFEIPAFARGTNFAPGGVALVGERGPELVTLPRGSRVDTAGATRRMSASVGSSAGLGTAAMVITNWREGTGYIRYLADEAVNSASDLSGERVRAGVA